MTTTGIDLDLADIMDPNDPRMRKFRSDLLGMDYSEKELRANELSKRYGFNPTQSRKISRVLNELAKRNLWSESTAATKSVSGSDGNVSIDGPSEDTSDFATAAPGPRIVKKKTI